MSDKINSYICLMLSVYESSCHRLSNMAGKDIILQDLTGLENGKRNN